jgi:rSAM/selenodomain-associated transferase 2
MTLSIIVPVLNEAQWLPQLIEHLLPLHHQGVEIIVVDGGSEDDSSPIAKTAGFTVLHTERGRAPQMNVGATAASGDVLLFLHADTRLPKNAEQLIHHALLDGRHLWGRFDVRISGDVFMLRVIAALMNLRSRVTGIATGDQAMFMTRVAFEKVGGFPDQPLMEDIELSQRLLTLSSPASISYRVTTSGRRWERGGVWRTLLLMWRLRFAYWRGVSPSVLAREYR